MPRLKRKPFDERKNYAKIRKMCSTQSVRKRNNCPIASTSNDCKIRRLNEYRPSVFQNSDMNTFENEPNGIATQGASIDEIMDELTETTNTLTIQDIEGNSSRCRAARNNTWTFFNGKSLLLRRAIRIRKFNTN